MVAEDGFEPRGGVLTRNRPQQSTKSPAVTHLTPNGPIVTAADVAKAICGGLYSHRLAPGFDGSVVRLKEIDLSPAQALLIAYGTTPGVFSIANKIRRRAAHSPERRRLFGRTAFFRIEGFECTRWLGRTIRGRTIRSLRLVLGTDGRNRRQLKNG
jgi:hypothetical protein